jgi:hypothetical protein
MSPETWRIAWGITWGDSTGESSVMSDPGYVFRLGEGEHDGFLFSGQLARAAVANSSR